MQVNYIDLEHDVKPNLCEMFQENMLTNGKYNNAFLIILQALILTLFGPLYAILYSLPASILFSIITSCDCFCFVVEPTGVVGLLLLPFRLV